MAGDTRPGCRIHLVCQKDEHWTVTIYTREANEEWVVREQPGRHKSPVLAGTAALKWLSVNEMALDLMARPGFDDKSLSELADELRKELVEAIPPGGEAILVPQAEQQVAQVMLFVAEIREDQARKDKRGEDD